MADSDESYDTMSVIQAVLWVTALASRSVYARLGREPSPTHILGLLDIYIAYAARDGRCHQPMFQSVAYERRGALASKLRALVESWTPPELPEEILEAARALLHAEGLRAPNDDWETVPEHAVDPDLMLWPEGVPALVRYRATRLT
jgi:hypothetical protein